MNTTLSTIETIANNEVYKQVIRESMGGVMYNVANYGKYDASEVLAIWDEMTPQEQNSVGGIMKGAINFLQGN